MLVHLVVFVAASPFVAEPFAYPTANPAAAPHLAQAKGLLDSGDANAALERCKEAFKVAPTYPPVRVCQGMALLRLANAAAAENAFVAAAKLDSKYAMAWWMAGQSRYAAGKHDKDTVAAFRRAVELQPTIPELRRDAAVELLTLARTDTAGAKAWFEQAAEVTRDWDTLDGIKDAPNLPVLNAVANEALDRTVLAITTWRAMKDLVQAGELPADPYHEVLRVRVTLGAILAEGRPEDRDYVVYDWCLDHRCPSPTATAIAPGGVAPTGAVPPAGASPDPAAMMRQVSLTVAALPKKDLHAWMREALAPLSGSVHADEVLQLGAIVEVLDGNEASARKVAERFPSLREQLRRAKTIKRTWSP